MSAGGSYAATSSPASSTTRLATPGFDPRPHLEDMPLFTRDRRRRSKTHGRWPGPQGHTRTLVSGEHDGIHLRVNHRAQNMGIIPAGTSLAVASDVELKVAQTMWETWTRTGTTSRETIVINKPEGPCEGRLSCDSLLERFLPPQGELTVYWPGCQHRTYRGGTAS